MYKQDIVPSSIRNEVHKFVELLLSANVGLKKVILFGSFAKGTDHKWSDIDIAVVASKFGRDPFREMTRLARLSTLVSDRIEAIALTRNRLKDKYSTLVGEINRWGKVVYQTK